MKKRILTYLLACLLPVAGMAANVLRGNYSLQQVQVRKTNNQVTVSFRLTMDELKLNTMQSLVIQPVLKGQNNQSIRLKPVLINGKAAHIQYLRSGNPNYPAAIELRRFNGKPQSYTYEQMVSYQDWMQQAEVGTVVDVCACGDIQDNSYEKLLALNFDPYPQMKFAFVTPQIEKTKIRNEVGQAFLDFKVNRTDIDPDYRKNPVELEKINHTIDVVLKDANLSITGIAIHGYASPDGRYDANARLAEGRAAALRAYVENRYALKNVKYSVETTPEDWEGLKKRVEARTDLPQRDSLLVLIAASGDPDAREMQIRKTFPDVYKTLVEEVYPSLRHSDYRIDYVVRPFTLDEIRVIFKQSPKQLSQNEIYSLAQTYQPGTEEYSEVIRAAAALFPNDETANLNAANVALMHREVETARAYLAKAGRSAQALNANGLLSFLQKRPDEAHRYWEEAAQAGCAEATHNLKAMEGATQAD